ncbi:hypothetical protein HQ865_09595 [Mucilaginibacter mali]|uniref:Peptidase M56 domain-containing protein n=1 Tax=Mucilaginibacter mali TaxID=2740462 RepID=A0A7D4UAJ0_9SPHI|nr:M56 family metallopeptidase [Mucilaginibacter mali]QKJ29998.1 hypothetical protein HQ865_09595 [Mucilaginibacter mali]
MPALFIYLIKVNVALLIFCAGYYAVLRHLTFYNLNRIYLVTAIVFSTLYPSVNLSDFLNRHEEISRPIQVVIVNWQEPVKSITKTFLGRDVWFWLQAAFWTGVILFAIRLGMQLLSLYRLHKRSEPAQLHHYVIRVIRGNINPFSFWQSIYINPDNHDPRELDAILEHEHIHVSQWHTLDILLGEISAIFYWFNPGVWLMKRAIRENIEFITDNKILQKGVDCKAYQYSLLNVNFGAQGNAIVNHFNISTIKKRIIMMNAKRSSNVNITRYLFLIPAVMMLLLVFSVSKAELNKAVKTTSAHMMRTFKTVITKIDLLPGNEENTAAVTREPSPVLSAVSTIRFDSDTTPVKATERTLFADTGRKITLKLKGGNSDEQPDIYLDGVKMSPDALSSINSESISNINVIKNSTSAPHGVIRIVTKGHEDKDVTGHFLIDGHILIDTTPVNIKGRINAISLTKPVEGLMIDGKPNEEVIVTGYSSRNITKVRLNGKDVPASDVHNVQVKGDSIKALMIASKTGARTVGGTQIYSLKKADGKNSLDSVTVRNVVGISTRSAQLKPGNAFAFSTAPVTIDKLSELLIILNGKEITQKQFKKVSAGDLESVTVLKDAAAIAKYGDKGKKGVLIVTTKK